MTPDKTITFTVNKDTLCELGLWLVPDNELELNVINEDNTKKSDVFVNRDEIADKVIFNKDKTTILIDGSDKVVVKCGKDDTFDPTYGFLYAYFLMNTGLSKTQANKLFDKIRNLYTKED